MKLKRYDSQQKKYYDGRLRYIAPTSKLEWFNLFHDRKEVSYDELVNQIIKVREEFYECMAEKIDTPEFKNELQDLINSSVNLLHCINIYFPDDDNYQSYNTHVNKINHRLLDKNYKWGVNIVIEGANELREEII